MSNDNKTLADVQPGGRVRLGDALPPMPSTDYNAYSDGSEPLYTSEQMRDYARAAVSAQPSPGGHDAAIEAMAESLLCAESSATLKDAREQAALLLADALPHLTARQPVAVPLASPGKGEWSDGWNACREAMLRGEGEALAARQPVGVPAAWMHTHKATGRVEFGLSPMYDCDFNAVQWDSVALYAAPAQAVDLGRWSQRHADDLHVAVHTALSVHAGSLSQKKRAAISAYVKRLLIDSQAVGK